MLLLSRIEDAFLLLNHGLVNSTYELDINEIV